MTFEFTPGPTSLFDKNDCERIHAVRFAFFSGGDFDCHRLLFVIHFKTPKLVEILRL
jgi:hypothetical protein